MPTLEGRLLKEWREHVGLTQPELGSYCRPKLGKGRVSDAERLQSSLSVESVLGFIHALERAAKDLGRKRPPFVDHPDRIKLSIFFAGVDEHDARVAVANASRALAETLGGGGRS